MTGTITAGWRKASYSIANGACVETASTPGSVLVRDTTDRSGPVLTFPAGVWAAFTANEKERAK
jgi:hypothetical protein